MSKTILITGASTGIGAATARHLAEGNTLLLHYNRSADAAEQLRPSVEAAGGRARLFQAELSSEEGCEGLMQQVRESTDRLDVLFNNAGGLVERQAAESFTWELMERIFRLNTFSAMKVTSLALPLLRAGENPCVIMNSSIAMRHGAPGATIYGASKGALDSLTRGLAGELAPDVRVNAVSPGVIETPFHDKYTPPEKMQQFREKTPLGRNGGPEHVAQAVGMIVENDFLTGETIDVNGGLFMR